MPRSPVSVTVLPLAVAMFAAAGSLCLAQGGFGDTFAAQSGFDTLNQQGGGGVAGGDLALNRARDVAGGGGGDPFGGGGAGDPFGGGGGAGDPFGGGGAGAPGGGGFSLPTIKAIYGKRVVCHVTGQMLEDARETSASSAFQNQYYDDGKTGGDSTADDLVYTNVTFINDVLSPEAFLVKTRVIRALESAENLAPNEFFNVNVASTDPLSGVPQMLDLETDRDEKLLSWARRFLRDFRTNPDDETTGNWKFYPAFMPPPPRTPDAILPANFWPATDENGRFFAVQSTPGQAGGQGGLDAQQGVRDVMGASNIQDNAAASSSYFGGMGAPK